jgi:hypothetical protein
LFYGTLRKRKTHILIAYISETNFIIIEMSPINIDGKYTLKKEDIRV